MSEPIQDAHAVFLAALDKDPTERPKFLDEACLNNPQIRDQVEELLRALDDAGDFMRQPLLNRGQDADLHQLKDANLQGYEIFSEIARGGMGAVYRVHEHKFDRSLALKVMLPEAARQSQLVERFRREAQITGQLQHPGIPPVYDQGTLAHGVPFFTLKLIEGQTLDYLLKHRSDRSQDLPYYFSVFEQICQTMGYAHMQKTIHRDLKPANIMVGAFGEVQVMDWGLAKKLGVFPAAVAAPPETSHVPAANGNAQESGTAPTSEDSVTELNVGSDGSRTQEGKVMGTIAYMAPEQARGEVTQVDERCDVFALGAILCTILTGLPPYRGNGKEPWQQARAADLTDAWQRLDTSGADHEVTAICRACLSAERDDRPENAGEVAQRVTAYLASVQTRLQQAEIEAAEANVRAQSEQEQRALAEGKANAERKRRRATLVMAVVGFLFLGSLGLGGFAAWQQSMLETARYSAGMERIYQLLEKYRYKEAQQSCSQLTATLSFWVPQRLQDRLKQTQQEVEFLKTLDQVRQNKAMIGAGKFFNRHRAAQEYDSAFAKHAFFSLSEEAFADSVASWVRSRPAVVQEQVLAALDDWAVCLTEQTQSRKRSLVLAAIARIDQNPVRTQLRQLQMRADINKWGELIEKVDVKNLSPQLLHSWALAIRSRKGNVAAVEFLERAQNHHPTDFWLLYSLAFTYGSLEKHDLAIACYRATLAIRPTAPSVYNNWGIALDHKKDWNGAIAKFKKALSADPEYPLAYCSWGNALASQKDLTGAIAKYQKAITLDPQFALGYYNWGLALIRKKDWDGAIAKFEKATTLDPNHPKSFTNWGVALGHKNDWEGAIAKFRKATTIDPQFVQGYYNWGQALIHKKDWDGAIAKFEKAATLDPNDAKSFTNWGIALVHKKVWDGAIAKFKKATTIDPHFAQGYYNWGLVLGVQNDIEGAGQKYQLTLKHDPTHPEANCNLGLILHDQGQFEPALKYLRRGHSLGTKKGRLWRYPSARWVKQCEELLRLDRKREAILSGRTPVSVSEQLTLADACRRYTKRYRDAARLYAQLFARQPRLAGDLNVQHRYKAACCAILAAAGKGTDAESPNPGTTTELRKQALTWLQADLQAYIKMLEKSRINAIVIVPRLQHWQEDPYLASIRDEKAIAKFRKEELAAWTGLWAKVKDLEQTIRSNLTTRTLHGTLTARTKERIYTQKWTAGHAYVVEMHSKQFDTYLRLEDASGNALKENDDIARNNLNSRLIFTPKQDGTYRIIATSYQQNGHGSYTILVHELAPSKQN